MNKTEMIQAIAKETEMTQKATGEVLDSFFNLIGTELKGGNEVQIMGFGKFRASLVKGREGKNPLNPKETMIIPDTNRVYFSAGSALKKIVNEKKTVKKLVKKTKKK